MLEGSTKVSSNVGDIFFWEDNINNKKGATMILEDTYFVVIGDLYEIEIIKVIEGIK